MDKPVTHEMFLRHDAGRKTFQFKLTEDSQAVDIPEAKIPEMIASMKTAGPEGAKMVEVMTFLVDAAKKDQAGRWVSASDAPLKSGQATLGNS